MNSMVKVCSPNGKYSWYEADWDYKGNAYMGFPDAYKPRDMGTEEIWEYIKGTNEKYKISTYSNVKKLEVVNGKNIWKYVTPRTNTSGYQFIYISGRGNQRLHFIMMETFNPKPIHPLPLVVDHVNDNPTDNRLANLHWVTPAVNTMKAQGSDRGEPPTPNVKTYVVMYDLEWNYLDCDFVMELERRYTKTKSKGARIIEVCQGKRDKYKKWRFRYFDELSDIEKEEVYKYKPEMIYVVKEVV